MLVLEQENNESRTPLTIGIMAHASWDILEQLVVHKHAVLKSSDVLIAIEKGLSIESFTLLLDHISSDEELRDSYTRNLLHVAISSKVRPMRHFRICHYIILTRLRRQLTK